MAYSLSNKCAKNLCKRTVLVLVQLIIKNVVTCFLNTVYSHFSLHVVFVLVIVKWESKVK